MPPQGRPRASKTTTSWQAKRKKKPRKKQPPPKIQRSKHPAVKLMMEMEQDTPAMREAAMAGFQSEHCPEGTVPKREIARMKLPNGNMKRIYGCDICGRVASTETVT